MTLRSLATIAEELALPSEAWVPYGRWAAKIDPTRLKVRPGSEAGRIVLVTGMTPTAHGVGKSVTTIALGAALHQLGVRSIACLRQPSLGPVFGIKGGGAGGGRATVEPLAEVNLGLTGDLDAITNAHNLLASVIDNHLHHGNRLELDPEGVLWPRALDLEDRALRQIEIGLGKGNGPSRHASFLITPASEVTSILGLSSGPVDLKERLERVLIGRRRDGRPVTAADLDVGGAMAALLRHALLPNLLQSSEGSPVLVHGGPFGNLSYGTTTLNALRVARQLADVVLVEAGFGSDLGGEKFVDLVSPLGDVFPTAAVLVASLPTLRAHAPDQHGGAEALGPGLANLEQHVLNMRSFGLDPVVALNRFPDDTPAEVDEVRAFLAGLSVQMEESHGFREGGSGCRSLARSVAEAARRGLPARPVYRFDESVAGKIDVLARTIYGGDGADLSELAEQQLAATDWKEAARAPVCLAKTALSLSDDPRKLGRPRGFRVRVRELVPAAGAGYLVALLGDIRTMPGLPSDPRLRRIGLAADGTPDGVS